MSEDLILEGNNYRGKFSANKVSHEVRRGSHYTEHNEDAYFYKGKGLITKLDSGEEARFLLSTKDSFSDSIPFEEYMIWIYNEASLNTKADNSFIVDKSGVIDLVLSFMYNETKGRLDKGGEIIPTISPPDLNYEELVEKGLMADKTKQISLGLKYSQPPSQ